MIAMALLCFPFHAILMLFHYDAHARVLQHKNHLQWFSFSILLLHENFAQARRKIYPLNGWTSWSEQRPCKGSFDNNVMQNDRPHHCMPLHHVSIMRAHLQAEWINKNKSASSTSLEIILTIIFPCFGCALSRAVVWFCRLGQIWWLVLNKAYTLQGGD